MTSAQWTKVHNAINKSGTPDLSKGFEGWQKQAQITRSAIMEAKRQIDEEKAGLSEIFSQKEVERRSAALDSSYKGITRLGVEKLEKGLEAVVAAKRERFKEVALSAPTPEQLRLLQAMALRDDLTDGEIAEVAASMSENLQALKALASIARKQGHDFPAVVTQEEMERDLTTAERFSRDMLQSIEVPDEAQTYHQRCFWNHINTGLPKATYEKLDRVTFAAVQVKPEPKENPESKPAAKPQEPPKPATVIHVTDGIDNLSWLATKYHTRIPAIIAENPGADLDKVKTTDRLPADITLTITPGEGYTEGEDL